MNSSFIVDDKDRIIMFIAPDGWTRSYTYDDNDKILTTKTETGYTSTFVRRDNGEIRSWSNSVGMSFSHYDPEALPPMLPRWPI
jgi:YD repeat-containing protein